MRLPSRQIKQLKSNLEDLQLSIIAVVFFGAMFGLMAIFIPENFNFTFSIFALMFWSGALISAFGGIVNGRAYWWFVNVNCLFLLCSLFSISMLVMIFNIKTVFEFLVLLMFFLPPCFFSWRWGASIYSFETMKEVLVSKRIDVEKGTYSPFTFPFGILKTKSSKKWFILANASGPLIITLSLVFGRWLGKLSPRVENHWGAFCAFALVVLFVGCIRAGSGEYSWIRNWEKETGRKMYISYVVDWKRYKEQQNK
ncbi:MAG: hypothetical protein HYZ83_04080 [Candidatus Omnitrophica bacterium]|nr:hypothetical protein [Candidatus Omnitrophota bacterium]